MIKWYPYPVKGFHKFPAISGDKKKSDKKRKLTTDLTD
jgi:hypothetical protein